LAHEVEWKQYASSLGLNHLAGGTEGPGIDRRNELSLFIPDLGWDAGLIPAVKKRSRRTCLGQWNESKRQEQKIPSSML
jgi:hypothetical protein